MAVVARMRRPGRVGRTAGEHGADAGWSAGHGGAVTLWSAARASRDGVMGTEGG